MWLLMNEIRLNNQLDKKIVKLNKFFSKCSKSSTDPQAERIMSMQNSNHGWTLAYQEVILRIGPLGKLGHFESPAEIFCLHFINQLSKWANPKCYLLVRHVQIVSFKIRKIACKKWKWQLTFSFDGKNNVDIFSDNLDSHLLLYLRSNFLLRFHNRKKTPIASKKIETGNIKWIIQ